jgi:purine-nucleoside phosphorylase
MTDRSDAHYAAVMATTAFLKARITEAPDVAVVLGTGQDILPEGLTIDGTIEYADIPNFPQASVSGHRGRLVHGRLSGKHCLFLQGRSHWYEGYDAAAITLPIRVCAQLGAKVLLITNTAGGLNPAFKAGELMAISDHLNFIGGNPLRGANREEWGPRFPDMSRVYSRRIMAIAQEATASIGVPLHSGVYVAIPGPSLETPAETRFLRNCGADAVGMSTVPEVIVAVHAGLEVFGLSLIANVNDPKRMQPILIDEVINQAKKAEENTRRLLTGIILGL